MKKRGNTALFATKMACKGDQQQFVKHVMLFYALIKIAFQSITHQLFIKNKICLRNVTTLMLSSDISQIINPLSSGV